jgi:UDP-N-acetylbacillosamine N-acetyltransferase
LDEGGKVVILYILGAGKYGKEIEDVSEQTNQFTSIQFLDDKLETKISDFAHYISEGAEFYVAFGDNELRGKWCSAVKEAGGKLSTIIHPTAYISPKAIIHPGTAILPKAVVNTYSIIEEGSIINTGAIVDHDSIIGRCGHVCVGAIVKADNHIPSGMKVEAGVVIERGEYK